MRIVSANEGRLQYGPPLTAIDICERVSESLGGSHSDRSVEVEIITGDPYTNTYGVLTAIGGVNDAVLLTIEPRNQPTRQQRAKMLVTVLQRIAEHSGLQNLDYLAQALLDAGVLPTRDF